ncbi:S1 family peptidase [Paenibacillus sp. JZ16]|uniref:S1 family peptidase n=1 Tax=Paenibacillus sp. JZ16 TaxID=1906272 RepID=UPI00188CAA46|nr:S1 family peptidase [Paenibacillus sp. JZ16]
MYIDQASGGTINIGFKENTTSMLEASSINSFLPIKTFEAEYSEKEMEDAANLLRSNLSIVTELIPSLLYINVDFINQEIQIGTIEKVNDADGLIVQKISEITRQNKNLFKIVTDPTSKTEDNLRRDRIRPLQGGLTIDSAPSTAGNCSTGYSALDSSGNPYIMTAAHCWYKQPGTGIYQSDAYIGTFSSIAHYGNNVDAAAIRVSSTNLLSNQVYNETTRLTALQVPGNDVIGEVVCISGRNRGETNPCGTLQGKSASAFWEIMDNGVLTKVWFCRGTRT